MVKKGFFLGLAFAFFALGIVAIQRATPESKPQDLYKAIKVYSPYKFEQSLSGLAIINTKTGTKEKPDAADTLYRMDELEKKWGQKHLRISNNTLIVVGDNNQTLTEIFLKDTKEKSWVKKFYGI